MKKKRAIAWDASLSSGANARLHLPPVVQEFFALGRALISAVPAPAELHAFRLAAKRFRYTLEIFRPLYGPGLEVRLEAVRKIQTVLGKRQDCAVLAQRIRERHHGSETLRPALEKLERQGLKFEHEFRAYWLDSFDRPGEEMRWVRYLTRPPRTPLPQHE